MRCWWSVVLQWCRRRWGHQECCCVVVAFKVIVLWGQLQQLHLAENVQFARSAEAVPVGAHRAVWQTCTYSHVQCICFYSRLQHSSCCY